MELTIKATPKEIAALVLEIQERPFKANCYVSGQEVPRNEISTSKRIKYSSKRTRI